MINSNRFYKRLLDNVWDGVYSVDHSMRIIYWNRAAEIITGYKAIEVVGSKCQYNILMHVDEHGKNLCLTSCPVRKTMADGRMEQAGLFLRHKDGYRVPVMVRVLPIIKRNGLIVSAVETFNDNSHILAYSEKIATLEKLAFLDTLTELTNRRYFEMKLQTILNEQKIHGRSFGVMFIDIDLLKQVNDTYGHIAGDMAIKMVSKNHAQSATVR